MATEKELARVAAAVRKYARFLFETRNVNGVAVGLRIVDRIVSDEACMRIYVTRKLPRRSLPADDLLPAFVDGGDGEKVLTDIVAAGPFHFQSNFDRIRPAQPGSSIGATTVTAGTFGAVVFDDLTGDALILGNNHTLANHNTYPIGGPIVQPGPVDGGKAPDDTIATLLRFVTLQQKPGDNLADCALALPTDPAIISPVPLDGVPAPSPSVPAVALHFAGGEGLSLGNPIDTVLGALGVHFPLPGSTIAATPGMPVQKVGRTTGRTTGTVDAINGTYEVSGRMFANQISFRRMADSGDSGSLYVLNPVEGSIPPFDREETTDGY
jgi:hypothetical protein